MFVMSVRIRLVVALACIAALVGGCDSNQLVRDSFGQKLDETSRIGIARPFSQSFVSDPTSDARRPARTGVISEEVKRGTGRFVAEPAPLATSQPTASGKEGVTLNLVGVPIAQAAKAVLGDVLKVNYVVDDKVQGTITLQTARPVTPDALTEIFEIALKANGAVLHRTSGTYRIAPASNGDRMLRPVSVAGQGAGGGDQVRIVPLQYVSALEVARILESVAPPRAVLRVDDARNLVVLAGSSEELAMMGDLIDIFDVDWMKGLSFGLFPVKSSAPDEISKELEAIFGSGKEGPLSGTLRFLPNRRLSAVLVISAKAAYLAKAKEWIHKLDRQAERSEEQMYVYRIQNRPADQLANKLSQLLSSQIQSSITQDYMAPRSEPGTVATSPTVTASTTSGQASFGTMPTTTSASRRIDGPTSASTDPGTGFNVNSASQKGARGTRVLADEANNAVLVYTTPQEWDRIRRILERLDIVAKQVLIEAVIAEVTLNDELKFGLRWYFEKGPSGFKLTDALSGAVAPIAPGFSYFFSTQHIQAALNAVSSVTNVRVVSAPSLMVADNRVAKLQVGDQVPMVTQTAQSVTNPDAPVVNAVTLKDTGIILAVTPHVSDGGRVALEIEQEVSSVTKTTSSGIDSPTIQQRKIKTNVTVTDGQVLALGGLIQQRETTSKSQIPFLGTIPVVGNAFRNKDDTIEKTELLIFIRPRVVRDDTEGRMVTEEFRNQLSLGTSVRPRTEPRIHRDLRRWAE